MTGDPRADVLSRAAAAKRDAATRSAETGLRKLVKTESQVNFRAVAAAAGVSVDFLYRHPELRARIEHLRSRQQAKPPSPADLPDAGAGGNVVAALTAKLRQSRNEVAGLNAELAVAHGELLALRRQLPPAVTNRRNP